MATAGASKKEPTAGEPATDEHGFPGLWPGALGMLFLLLAVLPTMPEKYYEWGLPFIVPGLSVVMMVLAVRCRRWWWIVPFVLLVALFNPIKQPSLGSRGLWVMVDVAGSALFLLGAYFIYPKPRTTGAESKRSQTPRRQSGRNS